MKMNIEITKIIDSYLSGELNDSDRAKVEEKMKSNPEFKSEVEMQQYLYDAIGRFALKSRVQSAGKSYHLMRMAKIILIALIGISILLGGIYLVNNKSNEDLQPTESETFTSLDDSLAKERADFENLNVQQFQSDGKGEIFITEDGVIISLASNSFLSDGKIHNGPVKIEFQEALQPEDIMLSGLSTTSGNKSLATEGMFSLKAFDKNGKELQINPKVGVYVQLPVAEIDRDLKLFTGVKDSSGKIDWQNPKELEKLPILSDMNELDFYPPGYENKLNELKWLKSKKSRDSLYLSFGTESTFPREDVDNSFPTTKKLAEAVAPKVETLIDSTDITNLDPLTSYDQSINIPPSKVLGFWNKSFNSSLLATKQFEERMSRIHNTCDEALLNLYTSNLNRKLWEIDQMAVKLGYPEFEKFSAERIGGVNMNNTHLKNLSLAYKRNTEKLRSIAQQNSDAIERKERALDAKIGKTKSEEINADHQRKVRNYRDEYDLNMKSACEQLDIKDCKFMRNMTGNSVGTTIIGTGVYNLDKFIADVTSERKTATFRDPNTNKTATIKYSQMEYTIDNSSNYIKLYAYFIPEKLKNFERIDAVNGKINRGLNDLMDYHLVVIGYTENGFSFFETKDPKSKNGKTITLKWLSEKELKDALQNAGNYDSGNAIRKELKFWKNDQLQYKTIKRREADAVFRKLIRPVVFPCDDSMTNTNPANSFL